MTDEDKAEKAKENYTKVYLNGDMSLDTEEKYFAYTKGYCKGYTDGLAEGKPKWHDLRKNSEDLPKGDEDCLCFVSECYFVGRYVKEDKEWHFDEFISNGVIAWCEFPRFEE